MYQVWMIALSALLVTRSIRPGRRRRHARVRRLLVTPATVHDDGQLRAVVGAALVQTTLAESAG